PLRRQVDLAAGLVDQPGEGAGVFAEVDQTAGNQIQVVHGRLPPGNQLSSRPNRSPLGKPTPGTPGRPVTSSERGRPGPVARRHRRPPLPAATALRRGWLRGGNGGGQRLFIQAPRKRRSVSCFRGNSGLFPLGINRINRPNSCRWAPQPCVRPISASPWTRRATLLSEAYLAAVETAI